MPTLSPWPSEPLAMRTPGRPSCVVGCPCRREFDLAEGLQLGHREVAAARQHAVEHRADVAVAEEEEVLADAVHGEVGRVLAHVVEVQRHQQVRATQGAAGVAALAAMHHAHDVAAHLAGDGLELFDRGALGGGRGW
jgi:hypothetical protein